jgi:hypothetical protein
MLVLALTTLAVGVSLFWMTEVSSAEQTVTVYQDPT